MDDRPLLEILGGVQKKNRELRRRVRELEHGRARWRERARAAEWALTFKASSCLVKEGSVAGVNGLTTLEAGDET